MAPHSLVRARPGVGVFALVSILLRPAENQRSVNAAAKESREITAHMEPRPGTLDINAVEARVQLRRLLSLPGYRGDAVFHFCP